MAGEQWQPAVSGVDISQPPMWQAQSAAVAGQGQGAAPLA